MPTTAWPERSGWITTLEAAELLGVPLRSLYQLIDSGRLPAYKFGRRMLLKVGEVEAFRDQPEQGLA